MGGWCWSPKCRIWTKHYLFHCSLGGGLSGGWDLDQNHFIFATIGCEVIKFIWSENSPTLGRLFYGQTRFKKKFQVTLEFALNEEASVNLSELRFHIPSSEQQVLSARKGLLVQPCPDFRSHPNPIHLTTYSLRCDIRIRRHYFFTL